MSRAHWENSLLDYVRLAFKYLIHLEDKTVNSKAAFLFFNKKGNSAIGD